LEANQVKTCVYQTTKCIAIKIILHSFQIKDFITERAEELQSL